MRGPLEGRKKEGVLGGENDRHKQKNLIELRRDIARKKKNVQEGIRESLRDEIFEIVKEIVSVERERQREGWGTL